MFDNHIGDAGAARAAALLHPGLLELHLSHNFVTDKGALLRGCGSTSLRAG
jgi:hypothetical protein